MNLITEFFAVAFRDRVFQQPVRNVPLFVRIMIGSALANSIQNAMILRHWEEHSIRTPDLSL
jgi:hypothetical protein